MSHRCFNLLCVAFPVLRFPVIILLTPLGCPTANGGFGPRVKTLIVEPTIGEVAQIQSLGGPYNGSVGGQSVS